MDRSIVRKYIESKSTKVVDYIDLDKNKIS